MRCRNLFLFPCSLSFSLSLFTFHSARQPSTNLHSRYDPQLLSAEFISSAGSVHLLHIPIVQVSLPLLELGGREKVFFFGVGWHVQLTSRVNRILFHRSPRIFLSTSRSPTTIALSPSISSPNIDILYVSLFTN